MAKERGLPIDIDSEKVVLGSILLDEKHFPGCQSALRPDEFSLEKHRRIFRRMGEIYERGEHIDRITVASELAKHNELESVDGISYLVSLDDGLPEKAHIGSYIKLVKDKASLRKIIAASQHMMNRAIAAEDSPEEILSGARETLVDLELDTGVESSLVQPADVILNYPGGISGFLSGAVKPGISWGYEHLDELTMGLQEGGHYIIAGGTGSGKSSLAENVALNVAKAGHPVGFFSLEMSREQLIARALCSMAEVPLKAFQKNDLSEDQRHYIAHALSELTDLPLYIDDSPDLNIVNFAQRVDRAVAEKHLRLVILDYLQILEYQTNDKKLNLRNEYEAVTYASKILRKLARKHRKLSTVALSQLTKAEDRKREAEPPTLRDLRGSGAIANDAFAVIMMHRPEMFAKNRTDLKGVAHAYVRKSRNGESGKVEMEFKGKYTKFYDKPQPKEDDVFEETEA